MKKQTISTGFSKYSNLALDSIAVHIVTCMTGNTSFVEPIPSLAIVKAASEKFTRDLQASKSRSILDIAARNKSRKDLIPLLTRLGEYVMFEANGDVPLLASSGFALNKMPEPSHITNPGNVTLTNGISSGDMKAALKGMKAAMAYVFALSHVPPTESSHWESISTSSSKHVFRNLAPGKQYWVKGSVIGRRGQIAHSPIATKFIQ